MKHKYLLLFLIVGLCPLYSAPETESDLPASSPAEVIEETRDVIPGFLLVQKVLHPGGLLEAFAPFTGHKLTLVMSKAGKEVYTIPSVIINLEGFAPFLYFIQGLNSQISIGEYLLDLQMTDSTTIRQYQVEVSPRDFRKEELALNGRLTGIRTDRSDRRVDEEQLLTELLQTTNDDSRYILSSPARLHPVEKVFYTAYFGDRRIYRYDDGSSAVSVHNGLDYRAAVGEPIRAPFNGKVVMTQSRIVAGNTVVLEHLPGVYSLYYHLDSIVVSLDDEVTTGDLLGTAGQSGLATGSHLHWEIRARTQAVDPELFMEGVLLDRQRLISILNK